MSMDTVINTGHNRRTEPSNAGGHGLGEDKVAIKTDWGTVQPRKTEKKPHRKWERHESDASFKLNVLTLSENCVIHPHPFPSVSHTLNQPDNRYIHFIRQNARCPHLNVKLMFRDKTTWFLNFLFDLTLPGIAFLWTRCYKQRHSVQNRPQSHSSSDALWAL